MQEILAAIKSLESAE